MGPTSFKENVVLAGRSPPLVVLRVSGHRRLVVWCLWQSSNLLIVPSRTQSGTETQKRRSNKRQSQPQQGLVDPGTREEVTVDGGGKERCDTVAVSKSAALGSDVFWTRRQRWEAETAKQ